MHRSILSWFAARTLAALALAVCADAIRAQDIPPYKIDPYTRDTAKFMEAAGYVTLGPMPFGQRGAEEVSSADIEAHLSYAQIIWVETAHFRIGSTLPRWKVPNDLETRNKIRAELERLHEKLPAVDPKTRILDPWLRLHLFAQRLEDTYAAFQELLGVTDQDFPGVGEPIVITPGKRYMGYGPYLGMKDKYLVFLTETEGTYADYLKNFVGRNSRFGQRWHFKDVGSLFYGVSTESKPGRLKHDTALHCNVVFSATINLLDGFRHFSYHLPVWIREGLGHWFERNISPKWNTFDQDEGSPLDIKNTWKWQPYTVALIPKEKKYAPFSEAYTWRSYGDIKFDDHVALWSRVDFMIAQGQDKFAQFIFGIKGRVDENWQVDQNDLVGATREALRDAYKLNPLTLDDEWKKWVMATYERR